MVGLNTGSATLDRVLPEGGRILVAETINVNVYLGLARYGHGCIVEVPRTEGRDLQLQRFDQPAEDVGIVGFRHDTKRRCERPDLPKKCRSPVDHGMFLHPRLS